MTRFCLVLSQLAQKSRKTTTAGCRRRQWRVEEIKVYVISRLTSRWTWRRVDVIVPPSTSLCLPLNNTAALVQLDAQRLRHRAVPQLLRRPRGGSGPSLNWFGRTTATISPAAWCSGHTGINLGSLTEGTCPRESFERGTPMILFTSLRWRNGDLELLRAAPFLASEKSF